MKWFTEPLFGNDYGTNLKGVAFVAALAAFLVWSFPYAKEKLNTPSGIEKITENGITCVKPTNASNRAWNCWEEKK